MKFLTLGWWMGDDPNPFPAYREHLAGIRDRVPANLLKLQDRGNLHDAKIEHIGYDADSQVLELTLDGFDEPWFTPNARWYRLRYRRVARFATIVNSDGQQREPGGFGTLGYDEVDVTHDGHLEHRILFSSGIELQIVFDDFELEWKDTVTNG